MRISKLPTGAAPAGLEAAPAIAFQPGDFLLTQGHGITSRLIHFGQALRYWGADRKYAFWSHTALVVSSGGEIVEALGSGVRRSNISKYSEKSRHVVHLSGVSDSDRSQIVRFAEHCLKQKYGYLTIVSIAFSLLTGAKLSFGIDGQEICSGLVARALERAGEIFSEEPWHMMPASLAKFYDVTP